MASATVAEHAALTNLASLASDHPTITISNLRNQRAELARKIRSFEREFERLHGWRPGPADKREDSEYAQLKRELRRVDAALRLVRGVHDDGAGKRAALRDFTMQHASVVEHRVPALPAELHGYYKPKSPALGLDERALTAEVPLEWAPGLRGEDGASSSLRPVSSASCDAVSAGSSSTLSVTVPAEHGGADQGGFDDACSSSAASPPILAQTNGSTASDAVQALGSSAKRLASCNAEAGAVANADTEAHNRTTRRWKQLAGRRAGALLSLLSCGAVAEASSRARASDRRLWGRQQRRPPRQKRPNPVTI